MVDLRFYYPDNIHRATEVVVEEVHTYFFPYIYPLDRTLFESGLVSLMYDWGKDLD